MINKPGLKQIIFLLSVCSLCRQAVAFPSFDPPQFASIIKQVTTGVDKLQEVKDVINKLEETKAAIGDKISGFVEFAKDLASNLNKEEFTSYVKLTVNDNLKSISVAQNDIDETLKIALSGKSLGTVLSRILSPQKGIAFNFKYQVSRR